MEQTIQAVTKACERKEEFSLISGVVIGILVKVTKSGVLFIEYSASPTDSPLPSRSIVALTKEDLGKEVVLMFEAGHPLKPIIIGLFQCSGMATTPLLAQILEQNSNSIEVKLDGEQVALTAEKEIVLKCGKASLTLTKAGKILIHGTYILSRSSGVNKVKGGSVEIN